MNYYQGMHDVLGIFLQTLDQNLAFHCSDLASRFLLNRLPLVTLRRRTGTSLLADLLPAWEVWQGSLHACLWRWFAAHAKIWTQSEKKKKKLDAKLRDKLDSYPVFAWCGEFRLRLEIVWRCVGQSPTNDYLLGLRVHTCLLEWTWRAREREKFAY